MGAFFANVIAAIVGNARTLFKYFLFGTFVTAITTFSVWFVVFMNQTYSFIVNASGQLVGNSVPSILGCALSALGLDDFMNSAFAIFFSAMTFWLTAVGYILSYKLGMKVYDGYFKVLS